LRLGEAYQTFDDLRDTGDVHEPLDKPMQRDEALARPNAALALGAAAATERLGHLLEQARRARPPCARPRVIDDWLQRFSEDLLGTPRGGNEVDSPRLPLAIGVDSGG
jgi:geranylgeranyl pyrophosphate synthase